MRTSTVAKQPPIYLTIGNYYHEFYTKSFTTSQSIYFQNQNYFPISDGCSRRMFLGQTEYKERRLLRNLLKIETAQKLKRLFLLQQIMGLCWQLGTTAAKRRTPSRTIWQKTTAKRPPLWRQQIMGLFWTKGTTAAKRTPSWIGRKYQ